MRNILVYIILLCILFSCSREKKDNNSWLLKNTVKINSINPSETNYHDLQSIKSAIGDARIVLLGEQEHGDGSTYLAKSRLVKFLHDEMDFNVLAFESDFFGVNKAWIDYKNGNKKYQDVLDQLYVFWPQSKMCVDLFRNIELSQQSKRPMSIAGFDCQQLMSISQIELIPSLDSLITHYDISISQSDIDFFNDVLREAMAKFHDQEITKEDQKKFFNILDTISSELERENIAPFWIQEMDNLKGFMMHTWYWWLDRKNDLVDNNYRDVQMAENIMWLLNEKYPNEKIIIWVANGHAMKTDTLYKVEAKGWKPDIRQYPMGEVLFDGLGNDMYSMGFICYTGQSTYVEYDEDNKFVTYPIETADSSSLSYDLKQIGYEYSFLNLRGSDPWLEADRRMRIWRPEYIKGKLSDIYDGIFYIEEMQPNEKLVN